MKMVITRSQFYQSSFALLVWFQKIEKCVATKYDIGLPEMNYLALNLTPRECYNFYNLLSHRRAIRGHISVYAEKEKAREISCISLLATWLTDPIESKFRSHENIELKLREIDRKDLAHWILERIVSSLKRRQLDVHEINRQIEESEVNDVVRNRIGERITPLTSVEDQSIIKNENIVQEERQVSCVFWKVFFSCLIVLALVVLFLCFYRFLYTKLRCICRRFNETEDKERCLPEQTYGTTSCSDLPTTNRHKKNKKFSNFTDQEREHFELADKFSSIEETGDEILSSNCTGKLTENCVSNEQKFFLNLSNTENIEFPTEYQKIYNSTSEKSFSSFAKNTKITNASKMLKNKYSSQNKFSRECKIVEKNAPSARRRIIDRSRSENFSFISRKKNSRKPEKMKFDDYREMRNSENFEKPKWTSCSCNLMKKKPQPVTSLRDKIFSMGNEEMRKSRSEKEKSLEIMKNHEYFEKFEENFENSDRVKTFEQDSQNSEQNFQNSEQNYQNFEQNFHNSERNHQNFEKYEENSQSAENFDNFSNFEQNLEETNFLSRQSSTELSETYDELGLLFSRQLKQQSRPCGRKYCPLTRTLQRNKIFNHDVKKCKNRRLGNFMAKIMISGDRRADCSSGNICRDTYDEFELMRASREEREVLTRSMIKRRKYFLDQPCLSN